MITFIVYTKKRNEGEIFSNIIHKYLFSKEDHYDILVYDEDTENIIEEVSELDGAKIFLLDIDVHGIDIARAIRTNGDFTSPVILLCSNKKKIKLDNLKNILYLDILEKNTSNEDILLCLKEAYQIATRYSVLTFSIFDELYRLPYDEICYIEKNVNSDSVTIYTMEDSYQNYISIKSLDLKLKDDPRFYKSHRSCIINIYNVVSYGKKNNTIVFKNGLTTDLVARNKKKLLVNKLNEVAVPINE